jgi:hypothetical protein
VYHRRDLIDTRPPATFQHIVCSDIDRAIVPNDLRSRSSFGRSIVTDLSLQPSKVQQHRCTRPSSTQRLAISALIRGCVTCKRRTLTTAVSAYQRAPQTVKTKVGNITTWLAIPEPPIPRRKNMAGNCHNPYLPSAAHPHNRRPSLPPYADDQANMNTAGMWVIKLHAYKACRRACRLGLYALCWHLSFLLVFVPVS